MIKAFRTIFIVILLVGCNKSEIQKEGKILYDGCPECEGDEYVTSTKKWTKSNLTFAFKGNIYQERKSSIESALRVWEAKIPITFSLSNDVVNSDIVISFENGNHGDGIVFDGAADPEGNILAHGFFPPPTRENLAGDLHFDAGDDWTINLRNSNNAPIDLFTVALHELGHCLGLHHSSVAESIMYAEYKGSKRELHSDDIEGIQSLYGIKNIVPNSSSVPIYSSATLKGISKAILFNNKIYTAACSDGKLNSVAGYPDVPATWYKSNLINDNNQIFPIHTSSTSSSISDYDLTLNNINQLAVTYRYPTGNQYGFVMPLKIFNGDTFTSNEYIFTNANWGINPKLLFDNSNKAHIISWSASGYALMYHQKINSLWQTSALTGYNNIVLNLKSLIFDNKIMLSTRHNVFSTTNKFQTLCLFVKDLNANSWTSTSTSIAIDNNCDLVLDKLNQVYHLIYSNNQLSFGTLDKIKPIIAIPGVDQRASAVFDNSNIPFIAFQTASKVCVYKLISNIWTNIYNEEIRISDNALAITSISLLNKAGQIILIFADENTVRKKIIN